MIILDTNMIIRLIHKKIDLSDLKKRIHDQETFGISAISMYELYFGLYQLKYRKHITLIQQKWEKELKSIRRIEKMLEILPFTSKSAEISADIYNLLRSKGEEIDIFDCMIAGTIKTNGLTQILTTNKKHFQKIPGIEII